MFEMLKYTHKGVPAGFSSQKSINMNLPLAKTPDQIDLWNRLQPVNRVASTDTYKRTMSASSQLFAKNFTAYSLSPRRGLNEDGANGRLIMAGLEKILYPWFMNSFTRDEVDRAYRFFREKAAVNKFANDQWFGVRQIGRLPVNIWALPGGQTFLAKDGKHVPIMSVEGPGTFVTHLEPHLESIFAPLIHATKARLFYEKVGSQVVEFGLRSDQLINNHVGLMLALYVGGNIRLTSDDLSVMLFPEYFKDVGTIGHEFIMAYQREGLSLKEAQELAFEEFVAANTISALLPDVISTIKSGLPAILKLVLKYRNTNKVIMPRFDSGDIVSQCIHWKRMTLEAGLSRTAVIVEDGMNPTKSLSIKNAYKLAGFNPEDITIGAGGYFQDGCSRDGASLVYKRGATQHVKVEPAMKFSDTPGKESIPGVVRVYGRGNSIIVAQNGESIDGEPLMRKVVSNGFIVYDEDLETQRQRAESTWDKYDDIQYSPATIKIIQARTAERDVLV